MIKVTHTAPQKPSSHKPHRMGEGAEGEAGGGLEGGGGVRRVEVLLLASFLFFFFIYLPFFLYFTPLLFAVFVFLPSPVPSDVTAHRRYDTVIKVFLHQASVTCCWLLFLFIYLVFFFCPQWLKKVLSFFMRSLSLDHRRSEGSPVICCSRPKELTWPDGGWVGVSGEWWWWGGGGPLYSYI